MKHIIKGQEDLGRTKLVDSYEEAVDYVGWTIEKPNYCSNNLTLSHLYTHFRIDRIDGFGRYTKGKTYFFNEK